MATALKTGLGSRLISSDVQAKAFTKLPILDLAPLASGDPEAKKRLSAELQDAAINVGFLYIKNHGVSDETLKAAFEQGKRFFAQPTAKKLLVDMNKSSSYKGYMPLKGEKVDPDSRGDIHEAFDIGSDSQSFSDAKQTSGNQWPPEEDLPGFRKVVEQTFDEILALGQRLFPLLALALNLPEDFFAEKITNPGSVMRLLHYPSQHSDGEIDPKELGIGSHTDYGPSSPLSPRSDRRCLIPSETECFTLLAQQNDVEALQVLNAEGDWISAPPIPGTFVLNIADQIQRWSNDIFKSTVHRAINRSGKERQSLPFFFGCNYDAIIEVLPSCITPDRPAKYPPIKAGEWVEQRLKETYISAEKPSAAPEIAASA